MNENGGVVLKFRQARIVLAVGLAMLGVGCATYPTFGFPVEEGSIDGGRQAFLDHQCHQCHTVAGLRLPEHAGALSPLFELGGETSSLKAYSELVTSIVNPDHRISERYREEILRQYMPPLQSPMPMAHIETMTVRQLIDLVAFLDSRYVLIDDYETGF
jgi:L-cysteine S-thiosulfotransferase